jgi:hypothetical protein
MESQLSNEDECGKSHICVAALQENYKQF